MKDQVRVKEKNSKDWFGVWYCMPQKHGRWERWTFNDWNRLEKVNENQLDRTLIQSRRFGRGLMNTIWQRQKNWLGQMLTVEKWISFVYSVRRQNGRTRTRARQEWYDDRLENSLWVYDFLECSKAATKQKWLSGQGNEHSTGRSTFDSCQDLYETLMVSWSASNGPSEVGLEV